MDRFQDNRNIDSHIPFPCDVSQDGVLAPAVQGCSRACIRAGVEGVELLQYSRPSQESKGFEIPDEFMPAYCFAPELLQGRWRLLPTEHAKCGRPMDTRKIALAGTTRGCHTRAGVRYDFHSRGIGVAGPYANALTSVTRQKRCGQKVPDGSNGGALYSRCGRERF